MSANKAKAASLIGSVKVVYTDVDGTLVGPGGCFFLDAQQRFTLAPARALQLAHQKNLDLVMISGRNRFQLLEDARLLGTKHYIAELGCQIVYHLGREVLPTADNFLAEHPNKNIFQAIAKSGAVEVLFERFTGCLEYHTPWSKQRECTHLFRGYVDVDLANRLLVDKDFSYLKLVDNGVIKRPGTLKDLPEIHAYHLLPKESGKAEAVEKDMKTRSLSKGSVVAIGDAVSDLELADKVSALFLVKNSVVNDSNIRQALEQLDNVFLTGNEMGLGFAEVLDFLLR